MSIKLETKLLFNTLIQIQILYVSVVMRRLPLGVTAAKRGAMRPPSSRGERDSFRGEEEEEEERWPRLMLASRRGSKNVVLLSFFVLFSLRGRHGRN